MDVQVGFIVGEHASSLLNGSHPDAVRPGWIISSRIAGANVRPPGFLPLIGPVKLSGRDPRAWIEGLFRRVIGVDNGYGAWNDLDSTIRDQVQHRRHVRMSVRSEPVDRCTDLIEACQSLQELRLGLGQIGARPRPSGLTEGICKRGHPL